MHVDRIMSLDEDDKPCLEDKIKRAEDSKEAGNYAFKAGQNNKAIKKYHMALLQLKDVENPNPLEKMSGVTTQKVTDEDLFVIKSLRGVCYNNLAACVLKKCMYVKVIEYTSKTLELDCNNMKALFRRGQAYLKLKDVDKAENDFLSIKDIDADERCVDKFFPLVEAEKKRQECAEKNLYKKMMKGNT